MDIHIHVYSHKAYKSYIHRVKVYGMSLITAVDKSNYI